MHQLFIDFKKAYESVRREVLCNTLIEFGVTMTLVRPIEVLLNKTRSIIRVDINLCDTFPIKNNMKHGDALSPLVFNFAL